MKNKVIQTSWNFKDAITKPVVDISKLSEEEQADLIVERLKNPPSDELIEDAISYILSTLVADEIDKEILKSLKGTK